MTPDGGEGIGGYDPGPGRGATDDATEQRRIAETFADTIRDSSPRESLCRLCDTCLQMLPVSGVWLSVMGRGAHTRTTLYATDAVATRLAEIQYDLGEGPSCQASAQVAPIFASDLTGSAQMRRWPLFTAEAARAGARAVFSVPLGSGAGRLGTLDMYRTTPGPLSSRQLRIAFTAADVVTYALVAFDRDAAGAEEDVAWMSEAATPHEEVHQAAGMIMVRLGLDIDEAMAMLRARAFAEGRPAAELARDIVNRRTDVTGND